MLRRAITRHVELIDEDIHREQGNTERVQGGQKAGARGAKCLGSELMRSAEKSQQMSQVLSSTQYIHYQKTLGSNMGGQTYFLPPSNLGTSLVAMLKPDAP